jgi:hypothetical protein
MPRWFRSDLAGRPGFIRALGLLGSLIPTERLRTMVYLNAIAAPRRFLRKAIGTFYRLDHVYEVCKEFNRHYEGKFSILEFGVADGYAFTKIIYATRYLGLEDRVMVHGFDSFEGLPVARDADVGLVDNVSWLEGSYKGNYDNLVKYCKARYNNYTLHRGLFCDTVDDEFLRSLEKDIPILIWIDCDYYTSARDVFERIIPYIPTGCVVYFDDIEYNFNSRFTGEMRLVWEINQGMFGDGVELVRDLDLSCDSRRIYRFINLQARVRHRRNSGFRAAATRRRGDDSPFP